MTIIRAGVRLSPRLSEIYDALNSPTTLDQLCEIFGSRNCVKVQVHQLNGLLRATDYAILSNGKRPPTYRVANVRAANDNRPAVKRAA
jgi:hypothetical protein